MYSEEPWHTPAGKRAEQQRIRMPARQPSDFQNEAAKAGKQGSRSQNRHQPTTPPYTPHRNTKRPLPRSDSPASTSEHSIHPAETTSPAQKAAKHAAADDVKVEELTEGDIGYTSDIEVVYPYELEEVASDSDDEFSSSDANLSDAGIARQLFRLRCADGGESEAVVAKRRLERRLRKAGSRVFKRRHSQSVKSDSEVTDPDAMDDQDVEATARRLRRRTRGPVDMKILGEEILRNASEGHDFEGHATSSSGPVSSTAFEGGSTVAGASEADAMDVDDAE